MLIDTNQILPVTQLRLKLADIVEAVYRGESFFISDKGKIKAKIIPCDKTKKDDKRYLREEIRKIKEDKNQFSKFFGAFRHKKKVDIENIRNHIDYSQL